ncbi:phosphatidylinositol-specific phospholipase C domain-containing protein [Candidatus Pyrohabitans sp.]
MGQGGCLKIINASPYTLELTYIHSYQMNAWDDHFPKTISPGQCPSIYIEWCENIFKTWSDDAGEARYEIVGTNPVRHFEIQARWRHLQVDWQNTIQDPEFFPQPFPQVVDLGWKHNGTVTLTFCAIKKGVKVPIKHSPTPVYIRRVDFPATEEKLKKHLLTLAGAESEKLSFTDLLARLEATGHLKSKGDLHKILGEALGVSPEQGIALQEAHPSQDYTAIESPAYIKNWMETYGPVIGHLPLNELTLVCSHDSGTYDMVSPFSIPWASCQDLNINDQLNHGVRVLDMRVGCQNDKSGDERFILVHDTWRTKVTLKDALEQVKGFLSRNMQEVVILDFHRFVELNGHFDYDELQNVVIDTLGDLIYPYPNRIPTLEEIWKTPGRVVVAWNRDDRQNSFFPGVDQKWFDKTDIDDLYAAISEEMKKSHQNEGLWSICAILTPTPLKPLHPLSPDVGNWFQAGSEWAQKANIISLDFVEKTTVVQQAISECLIKGVQ